MNEDALKKLSLVLVGEPVRVDGRWKSLTLVNGRYEIAIHRNKTIADNAVVDSRKKLMETLIQKYGYRG